jgi:hypothetical protein
MKTLDLAPFSARISRRQSTLAYVSDAHGQVIGDVYKPFGSDGIEALAIATLFAASPELSSSLNRCVAFIEGNCPVSPERNLLILVSRGAINKAGV